MSAEEVAKAFTSHYFQTFDTNPDGLAGLFVSTTITYNRSIVVAPAMSLLLLLLLFLLLLYRNSIIDVTSPTTSGIDF